MFRCGVGILFILFNCAFALEKPDKEDIEKIITDYTYAWNEQGCKGFADGFAQDADFVNIFGMRFSGKEEIESRHIHILQTFLKESKMEILKTNLREVQKGVVIATIYWRVNGFRVGESIRDGIFTQVFVQQGGKWEITASQNTLISKLIGN